MTGRFYKMSIMSNRMTIGTNNNQIINRVIDWIIVYMMNPKNLWIFVISAIRTSFKNNSPSFECSSNSLACYRFKTNLLRFFSTFFTTKFILNPFHKLFLEWFPTLKTIFYLCVIPMCTSTFRRAIFWYFNISYFLKNKVFPTIRTNNFNVLYDCLILFKEKIMATCQRTKTSIIPRFKDFKIFSTTFTNFSYSCPFSMRNTHSRNNKTLSTTKFSFILFGIKFFFAVLTNLFHKYIISRIIFVVNRLTVIKYMEVLSARIYSTYKFDECWRNQSTH